MTSTSLKPIIGGWIVIHVTLRVMVLPFGATRFNMNINKEIKPPSSVDFQKKSPRRPDDRSSSRDAAVAPAATAATSCCCAAAAACVTSRGAAAWRPRPSSSRCYQYPVAPRGGTRRWGDRLSAIGCSAAATELLLWRSCCCDGAAAATELRSSISVALILRITSERRDGHNDETSIFISPRDLN